MQWTRSTGIRGGIAPWILAISVWSAPLIAQTGDTAKARHAKTGATQTSKPNGGVKAPSYGSVAAPKFGSVPAPKYGSVAAPKYGSVPASKHGSVPASKHGSVAAPNYGNAHAPATGADSSRAPTRPADVPPWTPLNSDGGARGGSAAEPHGRTGSGFSGRYYYMDGGVLHTWDFAPDGTYLLTQVVSGAGVSGRTSERGTYAISNQTLTVHPTKRTNAVAASAGNVRGLTAQQSGESDARRYTIRLLGAGGKDGIILDGMTLKVKTW